MAKCNNKKCSLGECDQPETCAAYVPVITNADHIRSMTDEELAAWIASTTTVCECCAEINECESPKCFNKCLHGVEDWLQQPSE